ncbi:nuclear body protein SP140-like protein [Dunckerocampus dactyliophorus]|uniref:nuclear body protein SP140-like protein n=1 Tax=Dunckerocampus dactyliophorus TaxID=161453 RepID=UPI0024058E0F|nr:nuclear body protein SP140-like protein [Dunckerocampus dactyliophorus]
MELPADEELLRLFHCSKTEMSCMENPHTFVRQLRDHNLLPEQSYKKVSRIKSKEALKKGLYEVLDWLEREHSQSIKVFWRCVFKESILNQYPTLQQLRNSLLDGSFHLDAQLLSEEREETHARKRKEPSEDENTEIQVTAKKKKKLKNVSLSDEEAKQSKLPTQSSPRKKRSSKICFSPLKKTGEAKDFWAWPIYKSNLPVTCGTLKGTLNRDKLSKGEPCILVDKQWFTPSEFERLGGKKSAKNWKISIRCMDKPLGKLIEAGHLQSVNFKRVHKDQKSLFASEKITTDSHQEVNTNQENEVQPEQSNNSVFNVTCGQLTGKLHKKRFASGTSGQCIRTNTSWMSPVNFVKKALGEENTYWKRDILFEGQPLLVLIQDNILSIHSLLCTCRLCSPTGSDLEEQKNDDECCVCKNVGNLVVCDNCPLSFHPTCHLPHVDNTILRNPRQWDCTFCIFKRAQEWRYSDVLESNAVMSYQISKHMLECQYLLLCLFSADDDQIFATNPSFHVKDYTSVVKTPMWLCKVADRLEENHYRLVGDFVSDVQLVFTNCALYNKDNPDFANLGSKLKKLFDDEFKSAFSIC